VLNRAGDIVWVALLLLSFGVERKKQRNTLQKAIALQLFAGYALLTPSSMRLHSAGFYATLEGCWSTLVLSSSSVAFC
jgi:hypothetical protein